MIDKYKQSFESKLPPEGDVINRNKKISSIYAELYLQNVHTFKWAGMAAFASNHIGIAMLPYHIDGFKLLDMKNSCKKKGLVNDLNLVRHINNRIFDDIAWTHQAYLDGGITLLEEIMADDDHYSTMLIGWKALDNAINDPSLDESTRHAKIWAANAKLLRHEQEVVVQPMFDQFGAIFKGLLTLCATLDFNPNHFATEKKYHSSFILYSYRKQFKILSESYFFPDLTKFKQRWRWLNNKVLSNWISKEKNDNNLLEKVNIIHDMKGC